MEIKANKNREMVLDNLYSLSSLYFLAIRATKVIPLGQEIAIKCFLKNFFTCETDMSRLSMNSMYGKIGPKGKAFLEKTRGLPKPRIIEGECKVSFLRPCTYIGGGFDIFKDGTVKLNEKVSKYPKLGEEK